MSKLDPAKVLGPDGAIARRLPSYEARPQQLKMAEAVAHAIASRSHLIVEAGTGVGKSFAYLVPAILTAAQSRRKVVVSTHTISLQEQLLQKDLPFLRAVMPQEFTAVLVKGRGNYISLRRLDAALTRAGATFQDSEEFDQLAQIRLWAGRTGDGTRSDLDLRPLPSVWDAVASENGNCLGKNCPRYKECFYFRARRRMWSANILVVNHALFMTDLAPARGRGEPPARLRGRDLRRGAHARGGRQRSPRAEAHQRPGRVHAIQALQRPLGQGPARLSPARRGQGPSAAHPAGGTRVLRGRRRLAGESRRPQRPAPQADGLDRHARRGAAQALGRDRPGGRGDRRAGAAGRAARRPGPLRRPGCVARLVARPGGRRQRLLDRGRADGAAGHPVVRPARHRADPPPRAVRARADLRADFGHAERRHSAPVRLLQGPARPDRVHDPATGQPVRLPTPGRDPPAPEPARPLGAGRRVREAGDPGDPALPGEDPGQGVRPVHVLPDDGGRRPR